MADVQGLVKKLERADARRQDVRARLVCDEVPAHERGSLDAELMGLDHTIEHYAKLINQSIAEAARRGRSPGKVTVGHVVDMELKQFLDQVKHTCDKLLKLNGKAPRHGSPEALAVTRDRQQAERLKRDVKDRLRECDAETRKTAKARTDVERERARIEREKAKVTEQRDRTKQQQEKVDADVAAAEKRRAQLTRAREAAEREKKAAGAQLRASRDARRRGQLEQRAQKLGVGIKDHARRLEHEGRVLERLRSQRDALERERKHLDKALARLDEDLERLGEEDERLAERREQLDEAREVQEDRLGELAKAEGALRRAAGR
ncbi:MAG: hypothetical protein M9894_11890 [Planctomycetes bacterium]|nr:hypothetical protein [Planctomycetota bacterium]